MAITYVGAGAGTSATTGTITPALPAGIAVDDILVMVGENANQAQTISNSAGGTWTQVTGSPQGTGTAGGTTATGCQVWWSRYNGTQTAPTISNVGDHRAARIYAYRGVSTSNAVNASTGAVEATSDTSLSAPGVTTTAADCWVLHAATLMDDAQNFGATFTNANLTGITVRDASFGHAAGNDGRLVLVDGVKAAAGATGNTTNTLTAASVKAFVTLALEPGVVPGAATITPAVFDLVAVAVTATPGQATTSITPAVLSLEAVVVDGAPGPGTLILTHATLRLDPVAVTATSQPVTTSITPAVVRLGGGSVIVPLRETFDKANGTPLGPERTWTRYINPPAHQWEIVSNRAQFAITNAAAETFETDIQVPTPNIAGIPNQQAQLTVTSATHPSVPNYGFTLNLLFRFALYDSNNNYRAYSAGLYWNDATFPETEDHGLWLILGRYDAHDQFTILWVDGIGADDVGLPGTLVARADGNQISAEFLHSGIRNLSVAATDNTYTDGDVAISGIIDVQATDSTQVAIDDLYAYTAPTEAATVTLQAVPTLRLSATALIFGDGIDALNSASPPADDIDAGDGTTLNLNDPELGLVTPTPLTIRLDAVPVAPVGSGAAQTAIGAAVFTLETGDVAPVVVEGAVTLTPAVVRLVAVGFIPPTDTAVRVTLTDPPRDVSLVDPANEVLLSDEVLAAV